MPGIGIGISPHFQQKKSLSSYWTTLISATVENAAPTHVVLTFPAAKAIGADDLIVYGFDIVSASWTGAVLTVVLSHAVLVFDEDLTIEFVTTGQTATVTNNVADDEDSAYWFDLTDIDEMTIIETTGKASDVNDKLGSEIKLSQATGSSQMYFVGDLRAYTANSYTTSLIDLPQPVAIYLVFRNDKASDGSNHGIFDGQSAVNRCAMYMRPATSVVNYTINGGAIVDSLLPIVNGEYSIIRVLFNNTSSYTRINNTVSSALSVGTNPAHGFSLNTLIGAASGIDGYYREIIGIKGTGSEAKDNAIFAYLNRKHDFHFKFFKSSYTFTPYVSIDIPIEENEDMNTAENAHGLNLALSTPTIIYQLFDGINAVKTLIGSTALSSPIYSYTFSDRPTKPKILIITSLHGNEKASFWAIYKLLKYIYSDNIQDDRYLDLKDKFDITVIPAVNPDGITADSRQNSNGVDLNRNFPVYYRQGTTDGGEGSATYGGTAPLSELESQALASVIDDYDIVIDLHNNSGGTTDDPTLFWISTESSFMAGIFNSQHDALTSFFANKYASMASVTKIGITNGLQGGTIANYALSRKNMLGVTLEIGAANPYVASGDYLAEILDMNEYIVFNAIYKIGLEYLATI